MEHLDSFGVRGAGLPATPAVWQPGMVGLGAEAACGWNSASSWTPSVAGEEGVQANCLG